MSKAKLAFIEQRHVERCGCSGEACDLGNDLAEFNALGRSGRKPTRRKGESAADYIARAQAWVFQEQA